MPDKDSAPQPSSAPQPRHTPPRPRPWSAQLRQLHGTLAPLVLLPLALTATTGMSYRLLRDWGGLNRDQAHLLMVLHEGEWLKPWLGGHGETLVVLLNGLGLLWMLITGAGMLWQRVRRSWGGPSP